MRPIRNYLPLLLAFLAVTLPHTAEACAVCFGKTDSPLGKGLHWGVLALLTFILLMLGGVAGFAVYLARRARSVAADDAMAVETPASSSKEISC